MASSTKCKDSELIAKRWAKALLELVQEENISKEDVLSCLNEINDFITSSVELTNALNNPAISLDEKQTVLSKLFKNQYMPVIFNFITELNSKGRLCILDSIIAEFSKELEKMKNILRIKITSAIELNDEKKLNIRNRIADKLKYDIIPEWFVDSEIIGGLIFNINETIIDNSIKHRLEKLNNNIIKG